MTTYHQRLYNINVKANQLRSNGGVSREVLIILNDICGVTADMYYDESSRNQENISKLVGLMYKANESFKKRKIT